MIIEESIIDNKIATKQLIDKHKNRLNIWFTMCTNN